MNNRKILVIFLALAAIFAFALFILPTQAQAYESAWLKVVTSSWNGKNGPFDPLPAATGGVADRFNVSNAFVELYTKMPVISDEPILLGTFRTNGTGFVQIRWPTTYGGFEVKNFTVLVHWKDTGIYIFNLTVTTTGNNGSRWWDGSKHPNVYANPREVENRLVKADLTLFAGNFSSLSKAFVAHAAVIFKDIQTFYADGSTPLGNTVIRVYENFITDQSSTESLIYAGTADSTGLLENVPIPLNLTGKGATCPYLNGSIAVWWETVLVGFENHIWPPHIPFNQIGTTAMNGTRNNMICSIGNATWEVYDNATTPQPLWGARIKVNVLPTNYLMHIWYSTDSNGRATIILPNSTNGLRYCYNPSDIVVIDTATFKDDVKFEGLGIEVEWKGGIKNAYGGSWVLVNYTFLSYLKIDDYWKKKLNIITAVYDIAFKVVNASGNPVDGAYVTVYRQNGPPIKEEVPGIPLITGQSKFDKAVSGFIFLHQLPGKLTAYGGFQAIYGVEVVYEEVRVFYTASIFNDSLTGGRLRGLPTQGTTFVPWWEGTPEAKTFPYIIITTISIKVLKPGPMVEAGINPITCIQNKEEKFEVSFINKGEGIAYNVTAKIIDAPGFEIIKGEDFSENIASGSNGKVDFILKPLIGGWKNIKILIKYADEEGKKYENTIEYKINVHIILRISSPIKTWIKINDEMFIGEIEKEMEIGKIKIEANPLIEEDNTRYEFIEWSDGIKENPREMNISSSLILNANYLKKYLLIIKYEPEDIPVKSKKLWQESNKIVYSDIAQNEIQINDNEKYVFKSWYIDNSPIAGNPISFLMDSPHEIIAKYVKYYKIIIISEYGLPSKEIEEWYEKNKEMPLPIPESPISNGFGIKYVFDHWEGEGILSPYSIKTSVIVDKPKTIKAIWRTDYTELINIIILLISIIFIIIFLKRKIRVT